MTFINCMHDRMDYLNLQIMSDTLSLPLNMLNVFNSKITI